VAKQSEPTSVYERLLREQLRAPETLDGIFVAGPAATVAITSDRLLIVKPTPPNGWEMKSIPWRLVTGIEIEAADETTIRLRFEVTGKRTSPNSGASESTTADDPTAEPPGELRLTLPDDGGEMADLMKSRLASARQA
jgi:hypothetical protein